MKLSSFKETKAETDGIWFVYAPGVEFRIASFQNRRMQKELVRRGKPMRRGMQIRGVDEETVEPVMIEAMSVAVLLDWKGITDDDDQPVEYTPELGAEGMKEHRKLYLFVLQCSQDMQAFQEAELQEAEKN